MKKLLIIGLVLFSLGVSAQVHNGILCNFTAGENITAPKWVYFSAGSMSMATNTEATQAAGLVLQTVTSGNVGQAYIAGFVSSWPGGGLTRGPYYLSTTTAGVMTSTRPSPASQRVGYAVSDTSFIIAIEARVLATGYGGGTTAAVSVDDASDKVSVKSEDGVNYLEVGNAGIAMYTQNDGVSIESGVNLTMTGFQNVVMDAVEGDMFLSSEGGLNITSQTSDVFITGNKIGIDVDSMQINIIPNNFTGERTFVTQSPNGYLTKQEGIALEDITFTRVAGVTGSGVNNVDAANPVVNGRPYKTYIANLTQTGTDAPSATILENTLGVTPTWARTAQGQYTLTSTGAWVTNKTALPDSRVFLGGEDSDEVAMSMWTRTSADVLTMKIQKPTLLESKIDMYVSDQSFTIEIRVYD